MVGISTGSPVIGETNRSISVSGNWRMTFELDGNQILRLNLEDYH